MIRGRTISIRPVRESDLATYLELDNDHARKGDFVMRRLRPEPVFRKEFQETGFLTEETGRLLIVDGEDRILGIVIYFRPTHYMDALELGYSLYAVDRRGSGITTEAVRLLIDWLFESKKVGR